MPTPLRALTCSLVLLAACQRSADGLYDIPEADELEQLRRDACDAACYTFERCDPSEFDDIDCLDMCMNHMPLIYEENQCGSREMQWMFCLGEVTCEQYQSWETAVNLVNYALDYPCVAEYAHANHCSEKEPFDMHEDNSHYP